MGYAGCLYSIILLIIVATICWDYYQLYWVYANTAPDYWGFGEGLLGVIERLRWFQTILVPSILVGVVFFTRASRRWYIYALLFSPLACYLLCALVDGHFDLGINRTYFLLLITMGLLTLISVTILAFDMRNLVKTINTLEDVGSFHEQCLE